jgi:hypothetical protein
VAGISGMTTMLGCPNIFKLLHYQENYLLGEKGFHLKEMLRKFKRHKEIKQTKKRYLES